MPQVIVHVGGHHAEELDDYRSCGWGNRRVIWVEAMPDAAEQIAKRIRGLPRHSVHEGLMWSEEGVPLDFIIMSNGESSSALSPADHLTVYKDILPLGTKRIVSQTLGNLLEIEKCSHVDFLNVDVQGAELHVLEGMEERIADVGAIYMEVNTQEMYRGCALLADADDWLKSKGFVRVDEVLLPQGWGDALYLPEDSRRLRRLYAGRVRRAYVGGRRLLGQARRRILDGS